MAEKIADICLVGVGEAGGILAKELGTAGLDVVAFERGNVLARDDYGARDSIKFTARLAMQDFIRHEPQTFRSSPNERATVRHSTTSALGGRMLTWTGQSARFTPDVFNVHTNEVAGGVAERAGADLTGYDIQDWPIDYEDLEPYYEKFEWEFGVSGGGAPNPFAAPRKKGFPLPPLRRNGKMELFEAACKKLGYHPYQNAAGILSETYRPPEPYDSRIEERPGCVYCGHCNYYGCHVHAKAAPLYTVIPVAVKTGNVDIKVNTKVFRIDTNGAGQVTGVTYFTPGGDVKQQKARVVILCGFVFENSRLLLLSGNQEEGGLANSSGRVGKGLCGHGDVRTVGLFDDFIVNSFIGPNTAATRMDDFNGNNFDHTGLGFIRGAALGTSGDGAPVQWYAKGGPPGMRRWGRAYKEFLARYYTRNFEINSATETLAHVDNAIDLDPEIKDGWGIPVPRVTFDFHQNERKLQRFITGIQQQVMRAAGASRFWTRQPQRGQRWTGGTCMGSDAKTSVVNGYGQSHDVPNLFVLGASVFTTLSGYPATATIGALCYRTAEYIKRQTAWFG
jgi:gluconate 2-dehydrogenase alpha chain